MLLKKAELLLFTNEESLEEEGGLCPGAIQFGDVHANGQITNRNFDGVWQRTYFHGAPFRSLLDAGCLP